MWKEDFKEEDAKTTRQSWLRLSCMDTEIYNGLKFYSHQFGTETVRIKGYKVLPMRIIGWFCSSQTNDGLTFHRQWWCVWSWLLFSSWLENDLFSNEKILKKKENSFTKTDQYETIEEGFLPAACSLHFPIEESWALWTHLLNLGFCSSSLYRT